MSIGGGFGVGIQLPGTDLGVSGSAGIGIDGGSIGITGAIDIDGSGGNGSNSSYPKIYAGPEELASDLEISDVQKVAKFAVDKFNEDYKNNLKYKYIYGALIEELDGDTIKYSLKLAVVDCLERLLKYEAIVLEKTEDGVKYLTLESFKPIN